VCDCELLGKTLREGNLVFCVNEKFYGCEKTSVKKAVAMISVATIINLVGKKVVAEAIRLGYVHPEAVLNIGGVPHAQIVRILS
jgi:hypothetical protein